MTEKEYDVIKAALKIFGKTSYFRRTDGHMLNTELLEIAVAELETENQVFHHSV